MTFRVEHRTEYTYPAPVSTSYGRVHLLPRDAPGQACRSTSIEVSPSPDDGPTSHVDYFGNRSAYFALHRPHTSLVVTSSSVVDVSGRPAYSDGVMDRAASPWESAVDRCRSASDAETLDARQFLLDSPLVAVSAELAAYAQPSFVSGRAVGSAAVDLIGRIYHDFAYRPGATTVSTPLTEVLSRRAGVCQDFAHVAIGCLRAVGLPARYVSGYLDTDPPPGQLRLQGADASHAWVSVFVPGAGWLDLDPTNDLVVRDRHVVTAWGRDYADVPPLKGVIFTDATEHTLTVSVDVVPVEAARSSA